jgi:hypothetical protein
MIKNFKLKLQQLLATNSNQPIISQQLIIIIDWLPAYLTH